jgi:signal transduction histidine kinase
VRSNATRTELQLDAAIAAGAFALTLGLLAAAGHGDLDASGVPFAALASLPLVARRRAPLAVFVVTALASAALYGITEVSGPPVGPTVALYGLAADAPRALPRRTLGLIAALLAVHVAAAGLDAGRLPGPELVFGGLLWGGTWLAGERARLRRERMAELEERALRAEREADRERRLAAAEERARIARDLHDSAGHAINVILVHAGLGRLKAGGDPDETRATFETIEEVARETVGEIDQLVRVLREDAENGKDEVEPPPGLAALGALVELHRAAGLDVTATVTGDRRPLPPSVDSAAYRILQEALTNAARHGTGSAELELGFEPSTLDITVANSVRDADGANGGGHGLVGMRERVAGLGGSFEAAPRDGRFRMHARLPLEESRT